MKSVLILFASCLSVAAQPLFSKPSFVGALSSAQNAYVARVLATQPANLIGYWPLSETSGTTATDISGQGNNATYSNCTLNQTGFTNGLPSVQLNGTTSFLNLYSAGLSSDFNGAEGSVMVWVKINSAWGEAAVRYVLALEVNDDNRVFFRKNSGGAFFYNAYVAGADADPEGSWDSTSPAGWACYVLTWSKANDRFRAYMNGTQTFSDTSLGTWAGSLSSTRTVIGAATTTPDFPWDGWISNVAVWSVELSAAEVAALAPL